MAQDLRKRLGAMAAIGLIALLAGCGQRSELRPKLGHTLPPTPYGRTVRPDAHELLAAKPDQRPTNAVELRIKSEPRQDDPYDLPPH